MINYFHNDAMGKLLLRLTVGALLLFHGVAKISNPGALEFIEGLLSNNGLPSAIAYGVYVGEIVAPLMIIIGFHARIGGLIIMVNMIFAILLAHTGDIFNLSQHGGWALELQAFYLFGGFVIVLLGSGKCAIKPD
ncbi:MAG: DoxX family protein [Pseudomonadales bacterium]